MNKKRLLHKLISLLIFVITIYYFFATCGSGRYSQHILHLSPFFVMAFFAASLWFLLGMEYFGVDCITYNKKIFAIEQLCFFFLAIVLQVVIYFVIPDMLAKEQFILVSDGVRYSIVVLFLLLAVILAVQTIRKRWQAYFSLVQVFGILCSMLTYNYKLVNLDELELISNPPFILEHYYASIFAAIVFYFLLKKEAKLGQQN